MKIISFGEGQSGKEWLEWRKNGVGASDIGILMGSNRYKTPLMLWNQKCGFKQEDSINPAMAHGIKNEEIARTWLNVNEGLQLVPLCLEDVKNPHFRASLDGYDADKKILSEIKCPVSDEILENARENRVIPMHWQHQIQWQIMLAEPTRAFVAIWDYRYESCFTIEAFAQPTLQSEMKEKANEFWRLIQIGVPPKPGHKDYVHVKDEKLKDLLYEYGDHTKIETGAKLRKKELREQISEYGNEGNFIAYDYLVTLCSPHTRYNMDQMKMDGIDIDKYIKKNNGKGHYRIKCPS